MDGWMSGGARNRAIVQSDHYSFSFPIFNSTQAGVWTKERNSSLSLGAEVGPGCEGFIVASLACLTRQGESAKSISTRPVQ